MKWFRKGLKPSWIFKSNLKVWRLLPGSGVLVTELRDPQEKVTEFVGVDLSTGSPLWRNNQLPEKWWTTLNKIHKDVLLLHQFARPNMPTPGKIFAVDLFTGKLLWQNDELACLSVSGDTLFALRKTFQSEDVIELDYRSGEEKLVLSLDNYQEMNIPAPQDEFILPEPVDVKASSGLIPAEAIAPMTVRLTKSTTFGFHVTSGTDAKGAPLYDALITIVDAIGKKVYEDIADRKVYVPLQDFFFVVPLQKTWLIYVRNSDEIIAVELS